MADTPETLENNWYKAIKGIKCTRLGIKSFVEENIESFHQNVYATALQGLPSGSTCSACSTQNVLQCPTRNICDKKNNCSFHDKNDPGCQPNQCPKNICNKVRDEVINAHRYGAPSFRNTSATFWHSSSWQLAKCFMAPTGYQDKMSADDTDFPGLISVILNHIDFQGLVSENLGQRNNMFEQARDARNTVMHSAGFELSSKDLKSQFAVFTKVLKDTKHIQGRPEAQDAVKKLQMILTDQSIITEQERETMRKEKLAAIKTIEDAKREAVVEIEFKEKEIVSIASTAKRNIVEAENLATKEVGRKGDESLNSLEMKLKEAKRDMSSSEEVTRKALTKGMEENLDKLKSETAEYVQKLQRQNREMIASAEVSVTGAKDKAITELEDKSKLLMDKARQDIQASMESSQDIFAKKTTENLKKLKTNTEEYSAELENQKQEMIGSVGKGITATKTEAIKELEDTKVTLLEEAKLAIDKSKDGAIEVIYKRTDELIKSVEEANSQHQQTSDHRGVGQNIELKKHLIEHYQRNGYTKLPLSPLVDDVEIDVDEVFVMPKMRVANYSQTKPASKSCTKDTIKSINDMFKKDGITINRICIGANGGYGKTTFCQMIISAWTKIQTDDTDGLNKCISKSDIEFLKSFDYLFYLPLRDLKRIVGIEEMTKKHLVKESLHTILTEVFRKESKKCFIILDGLDEWSAGNSQTIPQFDRREQYTVLMTSRPYKIERVRPRVCDVEQEIEMIGLTTPDRIVFKLVAHLNRKYKKEKNYKRCPCYSFCWYDTDRHTNIWSRFSDVPILLSHMVCLWYDGRDCGNTRLGICFNMIDMMLEVAENKEQIEVKETESENENLIHFPQMLGELEYCKKYINLLHGLSRLSFHTLLENKINDALIFPRTVCDMYGLKQTDIELCLKAALLSQSKFIGQATSKMKRLSFLHKTIQEVFAAFHIANNGEISLQQFLNKYPSLEDLLEDSEILAYICGLRPDFVGQVSSHIARLADAHEEIQKYRQIFPSTDYYPDLVERIQDCVLNAIEEASFESHKIDFVELHIVCDERLLRFCRNYVHSDEILQMLTVNGIKSFKCDFTNECDKTIFVENQSGLPNLSLIYAKNVCEQQDIDSLRNTIERASSLTRLILQGFSNGYEGTVNYSYLFTAVTQRNLTCLEIDYFECDHHTKEEIQSLVSRQTQLVALCIAGVECTTCRDSRCKFELDVSSHANLKHIAFMELTLLPKQELRCNLETITLENCENVDSFLRGLKFSKHITMLGLSNINKLDMDEMERATNANVFNSLIDQTHGPIKHLFLDFTSPPEELVINGKIDIRSIIEVFWSDDEDEDTSPGIDADGRTALSQNEEYSTQSTYNIEQDQDDMAASIQAEEWNDTEHSTETGEEFETCENQLTNKQDRIECSMHFQEIPQAMSDTITTLSRLKILKMENIDLGEIIFELSPNMVSLEVVSLVHICMSLKCFEAFVKSLANLHQAVLVRLGFIYVRPKTNYADMLVTISNKCRLLKVQNARCKYPIHELMDIYLTNCQDITQEQIKALIAEAESEVMEVYI